MKLSNLLKYFIVAGIAIAGLICGLAFADSLTSGIAVSALAKNVDHTVTHLATVLTDVSTVSGICCVMGGIFKLHQHKVNPSQVQISHGVALVLVGAALSAMPYMLTTGTRGIMGSAKVAQLGGTEIHKIIGSK